MLLAGWLAGLHGTGLPFHVQIASLPFIPLLTVCVGGGGGGSGWRWAVVNSLNRGAGYVWLVIVVGLAFR